MGNAESSSDDDEGWDRGTRADAEARARAEDARNARRVLELVHILGPAEARERLLWNRRTGTYDDEAQLYDEPPARVRYFLPPSFEARLAERYAHPELAELDEEELAEDDAADQAAAEDEAADHAAEDEAADQAAAEAPIVVVAELAAAAGDGAGAGVAAGDGAGAGAAEGDGAGEGTEALRAVEEGRSTALPAPGSPVDFRPLPPEIAALRDLAPLEPLEPLEPEARAPASGAPEARGELRQRHRSGDLEGLNYVI